MLADRILSQDDHDVRVMDASGEVATYSKSGLRQLTIVTTNPMPSYEGKIVGEDLHDEAHFPADRSSIAYRQGLATLGLGRTYTA
jgi:hypothetical protein